MRVWVAVLILILLATPGTSLAAQISDFEGHQKEAVVGMAAPGLTSSMNITIPAECHVRKATMNVSTTGWNSSYPGYPDEVKLFIENNLLWQFNGSDFGAFGMQDSFSNDSRTVTFNLPKEGGSNATKLRLPKKATIESAQLSLDCSGTGKIVNTGILNGSGGSDSFGTSLNGAGDVNGDGYGDIIVGAPYFSEGATYYKGRAMLYLGGPTLNETPDLVFNGSTNYEYFGMSVASAGDVNGDGYGDIIIGGPGYSPGTTYYIGHAQIFFGGNPMDTAPDINITGWAMYDYMGSAVSGAGDVNGDGFDDVIIGASYNSTGGSYSGKGYVYFGNGSMDNDNTPDLILYHTALYEYYGDSVSGIGDVNGDGYDDFAVGAYANRSSTGMVEIFFGGASPDGMPDLTVFGSGASYFGASVSGAGDVNADGFEDVIIGAYGGNGAAYIYYGGAPMNGVADVTLQDGKASEYFGASVDGGGDVDSDGYDDVVVGSPYSSAGASYAGMVYIYFGGPAMDAKVDANFSGPATYTYLGAAVAMAGDINRDGRCEVLAGRTNAMAGGKAYVFGKVVGLLDPGIAIGALGPRMASGYINGSVDFKGLANDFATAVRQTVPGGPDAYGILYCDVPVTVSAGCDGKVVMGGLRITYSLVTGVQDFSEELNTYIAAHRNGKDAGGNLNIPVTVSSRTPGTVKLLDLAITIDEAPRLVKPVPDASMDEDTSEDQLIDLYEYFQDDFDIQATLGMEIVEANNSDMVHLSLFNRRYVSVDALNGNANDNWTGAVGVVVRCADHWGSSRDSNRFNIIISNVNDPPVFTSLPPTNATGGEEYIYAVMVADGDNDRLSFTLARAPESMYVDPIVGRMEWVPQAGGSYPVSLAVRDGQATAYQNFTILVPNRPPRILSQPPDTAFLGMPFSYNVESIDDDGQNLTYTLMSKAQGLSIDASTGKMQWTPAALGDFPVTVSVSDGVASTDQEFTLKVVRPNRAPMFTSKPVTNGTVGIAYVYESRAYDEDKDALSFRLASNIAGMTVERQTGRVDWIPAAAGNFSVILAVSDGRGGEAVQEFVVEMRAPARAKVDIIAPLDHQTLDGVTSFSGTASRGYWDIVGVQVRIDSGDWRTASGRSEWFFKLDTRGLANGRHTLEVRAFDGQYYSEPAGRDFEVENGGGGSSLMSMQMLAVLITASTAVAVAIVVAWRVRSGK